MQFLESPSTEVYRTMYANKKPIEEWTQVKICIHTSYPDYLKLAISPIEVTKTKLNLKLNISFDSKINIKILDESDNPLYLRQYKPERNECITIDIRGWGKRTYNMVFKDLLGRVIASGQFSI